MLWPYLKIWNWDWIFGRAVKAISSLGVRGPWIWSCENLFLNYYVTLKFKFWNPSNPISNNQRPAFPTSGSVIWFVSLGIWQSNKYLLIISYLYCLEQASKFRQYLKGQVDKWLTLSVKVFSEEISWCSSSIIWKNHKTFEMSKLLHMINTWKWGLLGLTNY
jgi:hypothetical protein